MDTDEQEAEDYVGHWEIRPMLYSGGVLVRSMRCRCELCRAAELRLEQERQESK